MKKKILIVLLCLILVIGIGFCALYFSSKNKKTEEKQPTNEETKIESIINNVNLTDIPEYFKVEDAINQGCFVITWDKIYNKSRLDEFIKNTSINSENRIQDKIRIVVASRY